MPRIKIDLPTQFSFFTTIPVRITDLNYGAHVGNDALLSFIHEARVQFLKSFGYTELEFAGTSLIMADVSIVYKAESFYGDVLKIYVAAGDFTRVGFDLYYRLVKGDNEATVAEAKTGMVCYDYKARKVVAVPGGVQAHLNGTN